MKLLKISNFTCFPVFRVKFQIKGFCVPLTTEKLGYKEQNRGTKQKNWIWTQEDID